LVVALETPDRIQRIERGGQAYQADALQADPVTGPAHCVLTPYWSGVLSKPSQSRALSGDCVLVIEGSFAIP
jgi:hypothetical protein